MIQLCILPVFTTQYLFYSISNRTDEKINMAGINQSDRHKEAKKKPEKEQEIEMKRSKLFYEETIKS